MSKTNYYVIGGVVILIIIAALTYFHVWTGGVPATPSHETSSLGIPTFV